MDLDDILNQALDDFEEQEIKDKVSQQGEVNKEDHGEEDERGKSRAQMEEMMAGLADPKYGKSLQTTLKSLSGTSEGVESVDQLFDQLAKQFETNLKPGYMPNDPENASEIAGADREVAATMQALASAQGGMEGFESNKMEAAGEQMMDEMMSQFESLGEKEDYNEVIDGVMRQLLSKDLMYDPAKQICEKFPEWLAVHK